MDSLTKRLMSRSGLNPVDPTLPPVNNMRMVYLDEKYDGAEQALHEARVALDKLEKAQKIPNNQSNVDNAAGIVYDKMAALEVKERDYFARRYFGRDKGVLRDWNVDRKQLLFTQKIADLISDAADRNDDANNNGLYQPAKDAAATSETACAALDGMDKRWYDPVSRNRKTVTPNFGNNPQDIDTAITTIRTNLDAVLTIQPESPMKQASIISVRASLRDAEICQRLAQLVMNNRWDLPDELRKPAPIRP